MVCGIAHTDSLNENEQNSQKIQEKSMQRISTNKFGYDEKSSENEPEKCVIRCCGAHGVRYCSRWQFKRRWTKLTENANK